MRFRLTYNCGAEKEKCILRLYGVLSIEKAGDIF